MPIDFITVIGGAVALIVFIFIVVGLGFAFRKIMRWVDKVMSYSTIVKKNDWEIKLIDGHLEKDIYGFEKEMLLINAFNKRELRNLKYAFTKRKQKLQGGKKNAR